MDAVQNILGEDPVFLQVLEQVSQLAPLDKPCLVIGERGSGKESVAERLHFLSNRWDGPLIKVNCAALTPSLLDTELFGHEAGAFTGAARRHQGRFERADGGTLIMDEIATAAPETQEKILRVLEYGEFERVGGSDVIRVDVRVVGVANVDLPEMARAGTFREDLLDRLAFDVVNVPPLRARASDIPMLARAFAVEMAHTLGHEYFAGFSEAVERQLLAHEWPGNVRELKNAIERSVHRHLSGNAPLDRIVFDPFETPWREREDTLPNIQSFTDVRDYRAVVDEFERELLERTMSACRHSQTKAAEQLNLSYHQLRRLLKKHKVA